MVDYCVHEFKKKEKKDISKSARAMGRLKVAREKAKRDLSSTTRTSIEVDCLDDGIDFSMKFTRAKFEELNAGKPLCKSINADEAVAYGAAVLAANLSGNGNKDVKDLILLDVTPLSLGITIKERYMSVIIPRNTPIPARKERFYVTLADNQLSFNVSVYQGKVGMKVCFSIDANGILDVSAVLPSTGNKGSIVIAGSGNVSKNDIEKMLKKAKYC
ncbi:hypothetical protein L1987_52704 [Smallanthus sonchifolius]|uniref:Uncharacterized protein n=1 Tax=Smallanthus sonchifolius TaxID=185202 RepID=A0ACB9ETA8_9ASTR|nr:hypothetical protein L1987_52704 [Smallanthus sonchifolius]